MKLRFLKRKRTLEVIGGGDDGANPTRVWEKVARTSGKKGAKKGFGGFGPRRARFEEGVAQIGVELENGRRLYYMIHGDNSVERLDEEKTDRVPLISAFCDDVRVFAQSPMSDAKAKGFAARESDALERMTVINDSKRGRIYATPQSSVTPGSLRVPMLAVMEELAEGRKGSFVAGVMIGEQELVVLYAFNEGLMGRRQMQVAINPGNLDAVAHSFASITGLPDDVEIVIFEQSEFLNKLASHAWTPYPSTQGFYGIPARQVPTVMVGVAALAAASTGAYAGYWFWQEKQFNELAAQHQQKKGELVATIGDEILSRRLAFSLKTSVDVTRGAQLAASLRTEGSLVAAELKRDSYNYTVTTSFFKPGKDGDSVILSNAIGVEPNEGCTKRAIETTGGMSEIKVQYVCANPGAGFARFGW